MLTNTLSKIITSNSSSTISKDDAIEALTRVIQEEITKDSTTSFNLVRSENITKVLNRVLTDSSVDVSQNVITNATSYINKLNKTISETEGDFENIITNAAQIVVASQNILDTTNVDFNNPIFNVETIANVVTTAADNVVIQVIFIPEVLPIEV